MILNQLRISTSNLSVVRRDGGDTVVVSVSLERIVGQIRVCHWIKVGFKSQKKRGGTIVKRKE